MKEVLQQDNISTDSNIFECGCNSIKAYQIVNKIYRDRGRVEIRISEMFTHSTIQQLGQLMEQRTGRHKILLHYKYENSLHHACLSLKFP